MTSCFLPLSLSRDSKCYPPPKETSSACLGLPIPFDPTMNYVDQLFVQVDDLGNSGGADRLPQIRSRSIEILPEAVNDRSLDPCVCSACPLAPLCLF